MTVEDLKNEFFRKLIDAIIAHDSCLRSDERVTSAVYDEDIAHDDVDSIEFMLPYKSQGHKVRGKLTLELSLDN